MRKQTTTKEPKCSVVRLEEYTVARKDAVQTVEMQ